MNFLASITPVGHDDPSEIILIGWFGPEEIFLIVFNVVKQLWKL